MVLRDPNILFDIFVKDCSKIRTRLLTTGHSGTNTLFQRKHLNRINLKDEFGNCAPWITSCWVKPRSAGGGWWKLGLKLGLILCLLERVVLAHVEGEDGLYHCSQPPPLPLPAHYQWADCKENPPQLEGENCEKIYTFQSQEIPGT